MNNMERLTIPDEPIEGGMRRAIIDVRSVKKVAMTLYWALKKYEDTGLTPDEIMDGKLLSGWIPVEERLPEDRPAAERCMEIIKNATTYVEPPTYDVDKVVEQLDKASDCYESNDQGREHIRMVDLTEAIEIVKAGGMK